MSSESGQRYSMEELKRRNRPTDMAEPTPETHPTAEEWEELTERLELLESGLVRILSLLSARPVQEQAATQKRMDVLISEVAALRTALQPAGKKNERRSLRKRFPRIRLPRPTLTWLLPIPAAGLLALVSWVMWSSLGKLLSAFSLMAP